MGIDSRHCRETNELDTLNNRATGVEFIHLLIYITI